MIKRISKILAVATFVLTGLIATASAQEGSIRKVKVDFDFYAGNKLMPAGEYTVKLMSNNQTQKLIMVQQVDGDAHAMLISNPNANHANLESGSVVFNKYGDEYFFSGVQLGKTQLLHTAVKTRNEREVSKRIAKNSAKDKSEKVVTQSSGQ